MSADQKTVIVVEDEPDAAELFAEMMRVSGFRVLKTYSCTPAIAPISKERPDVVIMSELDPHGHYPVPPKVGLVSLSLEEPDLGRVAGIFQDNRRIGAIAIEHLVARLERCEFGPDDRGRINLVAGKWLAGGSAPGRDLERTHLR